MTYLTRGDKISCKILCNVIVSAKEECPEEIRTFEILARDSNGFYIFIPQYILIKNSRKITKSHLKDLNILPRFLGEEMVYIVDSEIFKVEATMKGMLCNICNDFYEYATGNQPDGTLICYACRQNPYFK